jgi:drug/metabolite transporter (DMT)-like permease
MRAAPPISVAHGRVDLEPLLIPVFCVLWSLAFTMSKLALADCPPLLLLTIRFLTAGPITLAIAVLLGAKWRLTWRDGLILAVLGIVNHALYLGLTNSGLRTVSSGLMALIVSTSPVFTALLAACFLDEELTYRKVIGLTLGVAGVAVIVESRLVGGTADAAGIGFAIAALLSFAGGSILFKRFAPRADPVVGNGVQMLAGGFAMAPFALSLESAGAIVPTWRLAGAMAYLILCGSIVGWLLWFRLLNVFGATAASAWHFLMPPLGMLFGWLLLGEDIYLPDLIGVVPVAAGIWLVTRPAVEPVKESGLLHLSRRAPSPPSSGGDGRDEEGGPRV